MTTLAGILAAVVLFVGFGLLRRGREPERCGSCTGGCGGHCVNDESAIPFPRSPDARS